MKHLVSISASKTKSLRGATAYKAVTTVKVEDEAHESNVKKGEKFYLKQLGKSFYFIDVEQEGGKDVLYQYKISKSLHTQLSKKHNQVDGDKVVTRTPRRKAVTIEPVVSYTGSTKQVAKKTIAYLKESESSILPTVTLDTLKWVIRDLQVAVKSGDDKDLQHALVEIDSTFHDDAHVLDQDGDGGAIVIRKRQRLRR